LENSSHFLQNSVQLNWLFYTNIQTAKLGGRMKVTDVRVRKIKNEGKMKAVVSVTLDDMIVIHDIKIIEGQTGLFVAMPSRKVGESDYRDIAHPINSEARALLQKVIFDAYEKQKDFYVEEEFVQLENFT
jgi:stage V sporulation protein G